MLIQTVQRKAKQRRQIVVSTHSETMLDNKGIDPRGVVVLETSSEGTQVRPVNEAEKTGLEAGLSIAAVVWPQTRPKKIEQLGMWG